MNLGLLPSRIGEDHAATPLGDTVHEGNATSEWPGLNESVPGVDVPAAIAVEGRPRAVAS